MNQPKIVCMAVATAFAAVATAVEPLAALLGGVAGVAGMLAWSIDQYRRYMAGEIDNPAMDALTRRAHRRSGPPTRRSRRARRLAPLPTSISVDWIQLPWARPQEIGPRVWLHLSCKRCSCKADAVGWKVQSVFAEDVELTRALDGIEGTLEQCHCCDLWVTPDALAAWLPAPACYACALRHRRPLPAPTDSDRRERQGRAAPERIQLAPVSGPRDEGQGARGGAAPIQPAAPYADVADLDALPRHALADLARCGSPVTTPDGQRHLCALHNYHRGAHLALVGRAGGGERGSRWLSALCWSEGGGLAPRQWTLTDIGTVRRGLRRLLDAYEFREVPALLDGLEVVPPGAAQPPSLDTGAPGQGSKGTTDGE